MSVAIRLSRGGSKKRPYYRIVVADTRSPRDGNFIEKIGTYNPLLAKDSAERVKLDTDRAKHWLSVGAQPTDRVARFLDALGVKERPARNNPKKALQGDKEKERAEERAAKLAAAQPEPEPEPEFTSEPELPPEAEGEPTPADAATNEGVSAEQPAEGAVEPEAETPVDNSADAPAEG